MHVPDACFSQKAPHPVGFILNDSDENSERFLHASSGRFSCCAAQTAGKQQARCRWSVLRRQCASQRTCDEITEAQLFTSCAAGAQHLPIRLADSRSEFKQSQEAGACGRVACSCSCRPDGNEVQAVAT